MNAERRDAQVQDVQIVQKVHVVLTDGLNVLTNFFESPEYDATIK
jgi:hypothetical protein